MDENQKNERKSRSKQPRASKPERGVKGAGVPRVVSQSSARSVPVPRAKVARETSGNSKQDQAGRKARRGQTYKGNENVKGVRPSAPKVRRQQGTLSLKPGKAKVARKGSGGSVNQEDRGERSAYRSKPLRGGSRQEKGVRHGAPKVTDHVGQQEMDVNLRHKVGRADKGQELDQDTERKMYREGDLAESYDNDDGYTGDLSGEDWHYYDILEAGENIADEISDTARTCLLYTSPSPRDRTRSRMPSSA